MIRFDPLLPGWLMVLAIALLAASAAWTYRRGGWPALPRAAAVALAALMLLGPMWVEPQRQGEPPRLALVCDSSASMARADAPGRRDRLDAARAALAAAAAAAGPGWKVEHWSLSDRLVPGSAASASGATSFAALAALAGERAPAAVVFASDGADPLPDGPEAALTAARIPLFALGVGGATAAANAAVRLDLASPTAFPGQEVEAVAVVSCSPGLAGRQAELRWSGPDAPPPATVTLADGLRVTHALPAGAAAGEVVWSVELSPLPGEATLADNRADAALRVVDRRLRLAVLEGRPAWDTAFAVRAWRRDRQLEVVARWKLGERVLVSGGDPAAPPFAGAAVVALGDDRLLDAATAAELVRFVAGGGGLLLLSPAGDQGRDGALAALDPLTAGRGAALPGALAATAAGRRLALLPAEGLAGASVAAMPLAGVCAGAETLLTAGGRPVAVLASHGAGRVLALCGDGWWRLGLDPAAPPERTAAVDRLWRQLARAVAAEPEGLRADRARYRCGASAQIAAGDRPITVSDPAGGLHRLQPAGGIATITLDQPGRWLVEQGGERLTLVAAADVRELVDDARDDRRLARLAEATGGRLMADGATAGAALARRAGLMGESARARPLVADAWWLLALAALLGCEWWLRRRLHGAT